MATRATMSECTREWSCEIQSVGNDMYNDRGRSRRCLCFSLLTKLRRRCPELSSTTTSITCVCTDINATTSLGPRMSGGGGGETRRVCRTDFPTRTHPRTTADSESIWESNWKSSSPSKIEARVYATLEGGRKDAARCTRPVQAKRCAEDEASHFVMQRQKQGGFSVIDLDLKIREKPDTEEREMIQRSRRCFESRDRQVPETHVRQGHRGKHGRYLASNSSWERLGASRTIVEPERKKERRDMHTNAA
ncbi:hypothetical protein B0H17DRAFT_1179005 [Mycena rosella]|uniref:Uncharacterized protein n=1 Tax=Mycena rosella TaxID=1033263 RepID=A0AAD7GGC7_MYCRO|nr:hypothetical protein B0H17DRAFT_1179005 [Mycena rosella]